MSSILRLAVFSTALLSTSPSSAERPFSVSVVPGKLTVLPTKGWHVNEDYPWVTRTSPGAPWTRNFSTLPFAATATGLPSGHVQFRGAVCSESTCLPIKGEVVIP